MELVIHMVCSTLPARLLAYAPFLDCLRFGKRVAAMTVTASLLLEALLVGWAIRAGYVEWVRTIEFLFGPVGFAACVLNIRLPPSKLLFAYLLVVDYLIIVVGVSAYVAVVLLDAAARSWQSSAACLILYLASWPLIFRLYHSAARQVYRIHAPRLWRVIWLVPALTSATVLIFTGSLEEDVVGRWSFLFARGGLLACVMVIYWVLVQSLTSLQKQTALEEQLNYETHLLEMQVAEQKKYQLLMVENCWRVHRQCQDLRHQLTAIRVLARADNGPLLAYIDSLMKAIPTTPQDFCENQAVNAIVSHYAALCQTQGISFTARLTIPEHPEPLTDGELCVIFGNLLENAAEACERMGGGKRFIRLKSEMQQGELTLILENSFDGQVTVEGGKYRSSKREGFGVGLVSVQAVARKHRGDARFEGDGQVFRSTVCVQI